MTTPYGHDFNVENLQRSARAEKRLLNIGKAALGAATAKVGKVRSAVLRPRRSGGLRFAMAAVHCITHELVGCGPCYHSASDTQRLL